MSTLQNTQILNPNFATKADCVAETIRRAILVGDMLPGQRITERDIRDLLKVSSSPIRESFHQLEAEGFLTRIPYNGMKVNDMHVDDPKELYFIVSLLQGMAVRISAGKIERTDIQKAEKLNRKMEKLCTKEIINVKELRVVNYSLHMILCGDSIHPWLTRLISALWIRFSSQSLQMISNRPKEIIEEHKKIIHAIKNRDATLAETLMKEHFENTMKVFYET